MIRALVFDCFGVLLTDALSAIVDELRTADPDKADRIVGLVVAANRGVLDPEASRGAVAAELGMTRQKYADAIRTGEVRNDALFAYITELRKSYKTALLSNITRGGLEVRFPDNGLAPYFDVIVASGEVGYAKPEPEVYMLVADRLGVQLDECVMIDDRQIYCDGARHVGMQAILYNDLAGLQAAIAGL